MADRKACCVWRKHLARTKVFKPILLRGYGGNPCKGSPLSPFPIAPCAIFKTPNPYRLSANSIASRGRIAPRKRYDHSRGAVNGLPLFTVSLLILGLDCAVGNTEVMGLLCPRCKCKIGCLHVPCHGNWWLLRSPNSNGESRENNSHQNARTTFLSRMLMVQRIREGKSAGKVADKDNHILPTKGRCRVHSLSRTIALYPERDRYQYFGNPLPRGSGFPFLGLESPYKWDFKNS